MVNILIDVVIIEFESTLAEQILDTRYSTSSSVSIDGGSLYNTLLPRIFWWRSSNLAANSKSKVRIPLNVESLQHFLFEQCSSVRSHPTGMLGNWQHLPKFHAWSAEDDCEKTPTNCYHVHIDKQELSCGILRWCQFECKYLYEVCQRDTVGAECSLLRAKHANTRSISKRENSRYI